ncbi:hypothetical protein Cpir12675_004525 [Ceratocystis pirilliformis]|uniref:Uncharacterized protein n=1 Tax=Ceratocystis pirilliformis TaxID=259994 RepID=A0ABR3YWL8_9PEZI
MSFRNLAVLSLPAAAMAYSPRAMLAARQAVDNCTTTVTLPLVSLTTSLPATTFPPPASATGTGATGTVSVTQTTSEDCDETGTVTTVAPVATITSAPNGPWTTEYTTVYETICETGVETVTYTITKVCTDACHHDPTAVPPGFTTTVTVCTACGPHDVTTTLTIPCETGAPAVPTHDPQPHVVDPPVTTAPPFYTTYVTEYPHVCETGIETRTYTVTQHCEDEHKCHRPTDSPPDGFTKTVVECTACGEMPITTTCIVPIETSVPAPTGGSHPVPPPHSGNHMPGPVPPAGNPGVAPLPDNEPSSPAPIVTGSPEVHAPISPPAGENYGAPVPPVGGNPGVVPPPAGENSGAPVPPVGGNPGVVPPPAGENSGAPNSGAPVPPVGGNPGVVPPPAGENSGAPVPPVGGNNDMSGPAHHGHGDHRNGTTVATGTSPVPHIKSTSAATSKSDPTNASSPTEVPTEPATAGVSGRSVEVLVGAVSIIFAVCNLLI